ncbi:hypothetical protein F2P56_009828 [Juglans regia]|uniref:Uncharacterized protein n=1 Tax=Juglans regia TaxID=51240 RepID=A0A833XXF1_JUGRE|nr:hypothetical protein F2P56_009828 [Juglans regia]
MFPPDLPMISIPSSSPISGSKSCMRHDHLPRSHFWNISLPLFLGPDHASSSFTSVAQSSIVVLECQELRVLKLVVGGLYAGSARKMGFGKLSCNNGVDTLEVRRLDLSC